MSAEKPTENGVELAEYKKMLTQHLWRTSDGRVVQFIEPTAPVQESSTAAVPLK